MKVVSDTSPICYLFLIGHIDLLPSLFNYIFIPEAVCFELKDKGAPASLRNWVNNPIQIFGSRHIFFEAFCISTIDNNHQKTNIVYGVKEEGKAKLDIKLSGRTVRESASVYELRGSLGS